MDRDIPLETIGRLCVCCAAAMLENGGETHRAEDVANYIGRHYNVEEIDALALPTGIFVSLCRGLEKESRLKRIRIRSIDLDKVDRANSISRAVVSGDMAIETALLELESLAGQTRRDTWRVPLLVGLSSGFFALLFGGSWMDMLISLAAAGLVRLLTGLFPRTALAGYIGAMVGTALITAVALVGEGLFPRVNSTAIIVGSLMPLLPGLAMTNAIRDTLSGDLVSGVARCADAILTALALAAGTGMVMAAKLLLGGM